jgi:hypothetical protein
MVAVKPQGPVTSKPGHMGWAARLMACLVMAGFAFVAACPDPSDARPRSSKQRAVKAAKAKKDREPEPQQVQLPPQPAPEDIPSVPERRAAPPPKEWPRAAVPLGPESPPDAWPEPAIKEALAQCHQLLGDVRFEFKELAPIRKGVCGTPAPVQLKYINDLPRVEVRPPATMSCPLAAAIDRWMDEVVQPRAKDLLDATVIRVVNLAAYDCRPRYNNPSQRMSYHAYAEAIDVAEFVTAKGEHINVLAHWNAGDERAQFLRDIHDGGCKVFGTVLGPEANEAHRNHFHLDVAKRRHSAYCQ